MGRKKTKTLQSAIFSSQPFPTIMASATLSALAGSLLSPLCDISLEKLISYLWDYLSSTPSPSSSDEAEKQQRLKDSLEALEDAKLTVRSLQSKIMKLFQKHKQNQRVVGLHNKLKDVGYDIQDLESEMNYMELERKVQEINKAEEEEEEVDTTSSQFSRKRSFPFHLPTVFLSKKKRRLPTSSQSLSLSTDEDIVRQVTSIVKQLKSIESKLKEETMLEELFDQIKLNGVYDPREHQFTQNERVTTSLTNERKIYGRNDEIQWLIEFLTGPNVDNSNVSVVPIVGMGGIGKTTLAQFVFNNREIKNYFDKKAWIYVSNHFDRFKITKEMVDIIYPSVQCCSTSNLDFLERELQRHLTGRKFLLVLDDVWSDKWQQLLAPLQSSQVEAIKIIMTCRDPKVLRSIDEGNKIILKGINHQEYWSLFLNCAFAENNPNNYSQELHDIGRHIVKKLMGSPLAAKTVGKLLGCDLTEKHWNDVLENDLWKLNTDAHDIMPALALSYYHLPPHLQQCFAFCSVLCLRNHQYQIDELICMWIANGYIHESGSNSKTMHDIGEEYYYELLTLGFLDVVKSTIVKMHDLMHDLAQLVSHGEICIYKSGKDEKLSKNVRHAYVKGLIDPGLVCETNNLRTLVLGSIDAMFALFNHGAFKRVRVLVIYDHNMQELPDAISHLIHLQYLDLWETGIESISESLCGLYQLRVLKLPQYLLTVPSQVHSLRNLEILYTSDGKNCLMCTQLRNLNKLRGRLSIVTLEIIHNKKEATKAKLNERRHIKELHLLWDIHTVDGCKHVVQEEVLESLQPHPSLEQLKIVAYMGSKTPSWLMTVALQKLQKLYLIKCRKWACLPATLGLLPFVKVLHLEDIGNITIECDDSMPEMFPSLKLLELHRTAVSFKSMSSSSSSSLTTPWRHKLFPHLQKLIVEECDEVNGLLLPKLSTLEVLSLEASRGLQRQVPRCLQNLTLLTSIYLLFIKGLKTESTTEIGAQQQQEGRVLPNLKSIKIECCEDKSFMQDLLLCVPSLETLWLFKCCPVSLLAVGCLSVLKEISLVEVELILEDLAPVFPSLKQLQILKKSTIMFQNMPSSVTTQNHNCFPCLDFLKIVTCDEVNGLHWPVSYQLPRCLYGLSTLNTLYLSSTKIKNFPTEVMATLHALYSLDLNHCNELSSVEGLQALPSLRHLLISNCPKFKSWGMEEMPLLCAIDIRFCLDLASLPAWLHRLPSLKNLSIDQCPKFNSLPEGGLPSSLETLVITECDLGLMERCQQKWSPEWLMIQHIPKRLYFHGNC
ncbi:P-loop containing nucleoside triphosphate hydrolase protein [Dioscorea alata]|uniref:P-loop containing nucleoside triphosphate hydrolase protein n=3 Tax=Dioscorea alata TaxID=55571 RepID=A0ACB7WL36_DIOAL|nr:P-loop containing nucleoside triphosphate hydrolase protein [Dioscorea alata]KAH7688920.1 P-loop containing nucleoside triphosphate hydrolase protein [Dioscorea alata]KAH7688921.1 P-loop containing nucleoside triphosphate hydrolase protein [Dioscorea alata]